MKKYAAILVATVSPMIAFADAPTVPPAEDALGTTGNLLFRVITIVNSAVNALIPIAVSAALLGFFYGLVLYIWSKDKVEESKGFMKWSLIALFVMVSVWGIINFAASTLGIGTGGSSAVPYVNPNQRNN